VTAVHVEDQRRAASIAAYGAIEDPPRRAMTSVVELAARTCGVPTASINVITETAQHQIATVGFEGTVCRREDAMCEVTVHENRLVVVPDARLDRRFVHNPYVTGELGSVRFYAAQPLVTGNGVPFGTLSVFDEVPRSLESHQLETLATLAERVVDVFELRLRTRQLSNSLADLEAMRAELERSNERLRSFAGQVSHDLKTPLTSLSLSLALIREQLEETEGAADTLGLLDRAMRGSSRMAEMIDNVLDYARLGGTLKAAEVDLGEVLDDVVEDLAGELDGVELEVGRLPLVMGDEAQLRAVLQNLVGNAAKFRDRTRDPRISVTARHVQRAWRGEVADNGIGVPAHKVARVFEPLARGDRSLEGSGIGLATCRRIIGAHGGSIGLDPTPSVGAVFWFELPD
jgi:signal transduction histidine kinase